MKGAQLLVKALEQEGVKVIFGYPGGAIMPVYDALLDSPIRHILARHEQGAVLAADGYARVTGSPGVCMATSGPGATNLVTGIANAYMDSIPVVAITGQVPTGVMGTDAFQEVDIFGITMPIVKHSFLVRRVEDIPRVLSEACPRGELRRSATKASNGWVSIQLTCITLTLMITIHRWKKQWRRLAGWFRQVRCVLLGPATIWPGGWKKHMA